jgi:hypothetical protein
LGGRVVDLKLGVALKPVRVVAVAAVVRPHTWLHISLKRVPC